jgi:hypothetical protein
MYAISRGTFYRNDDPPEEDFGPEDGHCRGPEIHTPYHKCGRFLAAGEYTCKRCAAEDEAARPAYLEQMKAEREEEAKYFAELDQQLPFVQDFEPLGSAEDEISHAEDLVNREAFWRNYPEYQTFEEG